MNARLTVDLLSDWLESKSSVEALRDVIVGVMRNGDSPCSWIGDSHCVDCCCNGGCPLAATSVPTIDNQVIDLFDAGQPRRRRVVDLFMGTIGDTSGNAMTRTAAYESERDRRILDRTIEPEPVVVYEVAYADRGTNGGDTFAICIVGTLKDEWHELLSLSAGQS